jgi:hypothetical protein
MQESSFTAPNVRLELYDEDDNLLAMRDFPATRWKRSILNAVQNVDELRMTLMRSGRPSKGALYQANQELGTGPVSCRWAKEGWTITFPRGNFVYEQVKKAKTIYEHPASPVPTRRRAALAVPELS